VQNEKKDSLWEKDDIARNEIPAWHRYVLTITEAAEYYHIGEAKLRYLAQRRPWPDFTILNGNRVLIKRERFERFLDEATVL